MIVTHRIWVVYWGLGGGGRGVIGCRKSLRSKRSNGLHVAHHYSSCTVHLTLETETHRNTINLCVLKNSTKMFGNDAKMRTFS